jgi:hypothetical protein
MFTTPAEAHRFFLEYTQPRPLAGTVRQKLGTARYGEESVDREITLFNQAESVYYSRTLTVRYGRYVVMLEDNSDMRALTPRPAHGERPWLCEAVFDQVAHAALARWRNYKLLLAGTGKDPLNQFRSR